MNLLSGGTPYIVKSIPEMQNATTIEELLQYKTNSTDSRVITISESLWVKLGKEPGETIRILPLERNESSYDTTNTSTWEQYTIVGVVRDFAEAKDVDPVTGDPITLSQDVKPVVFIDVEDAYPLVQGSIDRSGQYNLGVIDVSGLDNIETAKLTVKSILSQIDGEDTWIVSDLKSGSIEQINTTREMVNIIFLIFGLIALILAMVLVINVFNIIRKEQEYETGMFQAIGASKGETFKLFLVQGVFLGGIGSTIGTIASYFVARFILFLTVGSFGEAVDLTTVIIPTTIILTFFAGFLSCVIAAIVPSIKAARKKIIENLNPIEEQTKRIKRKFLKPILSVLLALLLASTGIYLLWNSVQNFEIIPEGFQVSDRIISIPGLNGYEIIGAVFGPILVLFGILIIAGIVIKPIIRLISVTLTPYLKKTRLLTEKNVLRHPKRTILTFWLIGLTTSYLIGMSIMIESLRAGFNATVDDSVGSDIQIYAFGPTSLKDDLLDMEEIDQVLKSTIVNALIEVNGTVVGHNLNAERFNTTVSINVVDTTELAKLLEFSRIVSPDDMQLLDLIGDLNSSSKILITQDFADKYDIHAGDVIPVNFTIDLTFPDIDSIIIQNTSNAQINSFEMDMEILAIVDKVQGYERNALLGGGYHGMTYDMFISWDTYLTYISPQSLPGQDLDLSVRTPSLTGNSEIDSILSSWFNFTDIRSVFDSYPELDFTTRLEFPMMTNRTSATEFGTNIIGIHTIATGEIESDAFYGSSSLVEKNISYSGTFLEELLNTTENVCVVDEDYATAQIEGGNADFGIGSHIKIYPQETSLGIYYQEMPLQHKSH